jgi:hypothetical protein
MSILNHLKSYKQYENKRTIMPDGLLSISDGVFDATLHRLGQEPELWREEPVKNREKLLNQLEKNENLLL